MILQGDALACLRELPAATIQTCITSPPYFGLRDYGTGEWTGGDPDCDHAERELRRGVNLAQSAASTRGGAIKAAEVGWLPYRHVCGKCGAQRVGAWTGGDPDCDHSHARTRTIGNAPSAKSTLTTNNGQGPKPGDKFHADQRREVATVCDCGAIRADEQVGLEATPDEYIVRLVEVFREVHRVLRDDGTLWLNIGDSYSSASGNLTPGRNARVAITRNGTQQRPPRAPGVKGKDLLGIPWLLAFALRDDGWYLRSDVIWAKPNPMPESVTDRPTSAHEHVFLLAKQPHYFYDADAIREKAGDYGGASWEERRAGWEEGTPIRHGRHGAAAISDSNFAANPGGRNKRNVWTIATEAYAEAHFATFPTKLVKPCVLAGSAKGDTVLDPFAGSGTVGVVCGVHGREFVGIELNPEYCRMAEQRIEIEGRGGKLRPPPEQIDGQLSLDVP